MNPAERFTGGKSSDFGMGIFIKLLKNSNNFCY